MAAMLFARLHMLTPTPPLPAPSIPELDFPIHRTGLMILKEIIKALTALVGRLSLSVGWKHGPERGLKTV